MRLLFCLSACMAVPHAQANPFTETTFTLAAGESVTRHYSYWGYWFNLQQGNCVFCPATPDRMSVGIVAASEHIGSTVSASLVLLQPVSLSLYGGLVSYMDADGNPHTDVISSGSYSVLIAAPLKWAVTLTNPGATPLTIYQFNVGLSATAEGRTFSTGATFMSPVQYENPDFHPIPVLQLSEPEVPTVQNPEPASALLMLAGLALLYRRKLLFACRQHRVASR